MLKINETLLENLFVSPRFNNEDSDLYGIFQKLKPRMFPGEQFFRDYLLAQSSDVQFEKAEIIVHRLCYESNFPPTFYAVKDVISIEELQNNKYSGFDGYIPRDHFLHIVNLYILGIYLFFYDAEFRCSIISDNRFQRNSISFAQHQLDSYKDFISEWKYFCLYHDVGYTQEFFGNEMRAVSTADILARLRENKDFMYSFDKKRVIEPNAFFVALEILSRLFTWEAIRKISTRSCSGSSKLFKFFKNEQLESSHKSKVIFSKDCSPYLVHMKKLEKTFSNQCLKPLLPIIGEDNIAVVGIDRHSGAVAFISICVNKKDNLPKRRELFYVSSACTELDKLGIRKNPYLLLFDDFVSDEYELIFLYDSISSAEYYANYIFNPDAIPDAYRFFEENSYDAKFYGITTEEQMLNFYFDLYYYMYGFVRKYPSLFDSKSGDLAILKNRDGTDKRLNALDPFDDIQYEKISKSIPSFIQKLLSAEYSDILKNICVNLVDEKCKPKVKDLSVDNVSEAINQYVLAYKTSLAAFTEDSVAKALLKKKTVRIASSQINSISSFLKVFASEYIALKYAINTSVNDTDIYSFDYANRKALSGNYLSETFIPKKIGGLSVSSKKLMKVYIDNLTKNNSKKNIKTYRSIFDHGFESAKYAQCVFNIWQSTIKKRDTNVRRNNMIEILFSISNRGEKGESIKHYLDDYYHIFSNVVYAIMVHNVFPSNFISASYKNMLITVEDSPFAYFSLLCDSLQQWNRPQGISHSFTDIHPYRKASEEYDIRVNNNKIYLFESNDKMMQKKLESDLDSLINLKNIKSFVEMAFSQSD